MRYARVASVRVRARTEPVLLLRVCRAKRRADCSVSVQLSCRGGDRPRQRRAPSLAHAGDRRRDQASASLRGTRLDIGSHERKLGLPVRSKEVVVLVSVALEQDRDTREDDSQALEEIRQLFARYRRIARHGVVAERVEPVEARADEANGAPEPAER